MMKRKEFMLGATFGLVLAAGATAGGVIDWPGAHAEPVAGASGRLTPNTGGAPNFAPPQGAPLSFADIFQQVAPAVVQIDVKSRVERPRGGMIQIPGLPFAIPNPNGGQGEGEEGDDEGATALGAGSGFFVSADGYIVTNNHVVADAIEIKVKLADERELVARVVGRDPATDLAVIKVEGTDFPFVSFEETAQPRVGDWVIAVGNPFGLGGTATAGIVSAQGRNQLDSSTPYTDYLQIDAAINRGNSGGPTFDIYGRVIGVNSAILSPSGGSVGIGFAIPASVAKSITDRLMRGETIERGYLGVEIGTLTDEYRESLGLSDDLEGAYINGVTDGGPADQAGLRAGDIVTGLNGRPIKTSSELTRQVGTARPGETLRLQVLRDGRTQTINVRSGTRPADLGAITPPGGDSQNGDGGKPGAAVGQSIEGLTLSPITSALRQRYDLPERLTGLVITAVEPTSRSGRAGVEAGMVIVQANGRQVESVEDFRTQVAAVRSANRPGILLLIRTSQGNRPIVIPLSSGN
ncbi:MAG: Do family serine endopeptidase [Brevundimonas sp.]|nr:MAG: Do family serine endopeptidase [Brevundimonas sp.]